MDKNKILIIDDEKDFCLLLKMNLERSGEFEVAIATDGKTGIERAKECRPDLILLDIIMPGMDGAMVAYSLNNDAITKNIPVLFLTAVVKKEEVEDSKGIIGNQHFVSKPVNAEELIAQIRKVLKKK
ncbi:MAG: response regulator [Candidatus Omnitrophota bacterium]|nr:response regulator [Candidatus Omnitrophota bacterium]